MRTPQRQEDCYIFIIIGGSIISDLVAHTYHPGRDHKWDLHQALGFVDFVLLCKTWIARL